MDAADIAELELIDNDCPPFLSAMANLSQPFDPKVHVPWDCLDSLMVSVQGCMVSMVSTVPMSETVYNFSCTWMQLQGNLMNGERGLKFCRLLDSSEFKLGNLARDEDVGARRNTRQDSLVPTAAFSISQEQR